MSNNHQDDVNGSLSVVLQTVELSNHLAETLSQSGNDFRNAMGWEVEGPSDINPAQLQKNLSAYEHSIGSHLDSIGQLEELLAEADKIAFESVKEHIPEDLTVLAVLEGETITSNDTIDAIADWYNAIDDDLDALYAESLFAQIVVVQSGGNAPRTAMLQEGIASLLESVTAGRENLGHILSYFA